MRTSRTLARLDVIELSLCCRLNQVENRAALALFRASSWLGDWPLWPLLAGLLIAVDGSAAYPALLHVALLSMVSLTLYKSVKNGLARERPCIRHARVSQLVMPLDRYSFPSGHTLHAFAFSPVFISYYPSLAWFLVPYTLLVSISRVILGVHYPSDVLAGAFIGSLLAALSFAV